MAEEGLLLGVAPHVGLQRISTRMRRALSGALAPFACVSSPLGSDVVRLHMIDQVIAVAQIADRTALPLAGGDLIGAHGKLIMGGRSWRAAF